MLENTIFGALSEERSVDWAIIFMELVNRLVGRAGKNKPTPICPFLYHLYESKGLLTEDEEIDYKLAQELNRYWISPERDLESESEVRLITGPEPNRVVAPVNQVKRGNQVQANVPSTRWVSTYSVKRRGKRAQFGGRTADKPSTNEPPTEKASTGATRAETGISATGGARDAMGPKAI